MKFAGAHCPVCDKRFVQSDDIVVCPICGAPHHRACYQQENHCALEELHITGQTWHPSDQQEASKDTAKCWFCGTDNPEDALFCKSCGTSLTQKNTSAAQQQPPFGQRQFNTFFGPAADMSPTDEIDGISVRDLSLFVGNNAGYFLPQFKQISAGQKLSFNFGALLFHQFYYLFRKMYIPALILLGVALIARIPMIMVMPEFIEYLQNNMDILSPFLIPPDFVFSDSAMEILKFLDYTSYFVFAAQVGMSLLANRIYFHYVKKRIAAIKQRFTIAGQAFDDRAYTQALSRSGGTSLIHPILYTAAVFLLAFTAMLIYMMVVMSQMGVY